MSSGIGSRSRFERWKARPLPRMVAAMACVFLLLSSCGLAGGEQKEPEAKPGKTEGAPDSGTDVLRSHAMSSYPGEVRVDLAKFYRVNGRTMARFRIVNEGSEDFKITWSTLQRKEPHSEEKEKVGRSLSGAHLLDAVNGQVYYTLFDAAGEECLCSRSETVKSRSIDPGESLDMVAAFPAAPESVEALTVIFPNTPPFTDVPVAQEGEVAPEENTEEADIAGAQAGEPRTENVLVTVEEENKAVDDDGKSLDVRLSADVLFALNKANLRPKAQEILREVASQIDESPSDTIKIDGHTDSSGNDKINIPLSKRRAESVKKALEGMVSRSGVKYQTAGHGSAEPVADNKTEEGRKKNRRVTVSFARPKTPEPTAAPRQPSEGATADPASGPVAATATRLDKAPISPLKWPNEIKAEIFEPLRGANGYTTMVFKLTNDSEEDFSLWGVFSDGRFHIQSGGGPHEVNMSGAGKRFRPLRDVTKRCVCSRHAILRPNGVLKPGETLAMWAMYKLPDDVTSVSVEIPWFHAAHDVPVK